MPLPHHIVVDIDGTLYDTKPVFARLFAKRHGIKLAPHEITEWNFWKAQNVNVSLLDFLTLIGEDLHSEAEIMAARMYPGAKAALIAWQKAGSRIHIASDRAKDARVFTAHWLKSQGLAVDELICEPALDKVAYARSIGAKLLIDDKPDTIRGGLAAGLNVATVIHPYNLAEVGLPRVISSTGWIGLRRGVEARFLVGPKLTAHKA